jgi:hypothetical protein
MEPQNLHPFISPYAKKKKSSHLMRFKVRHERNKSSFRCPVLSVFEPCSLVLGANDGLNVMFAKLETQGHDIFKMKQKKGYCNWLQPRIFVTESVYLTITPNLHCFHYAYRLSTV